MNRVDVDCHKCGIIARDVSEERGEALAEQHERTLGLDDHEVWLIHLT